MRGTQIPRMGIGRRVRRTFLAGWRWIAVGCVMAGLASGAVATASEYRQSAAVTLTKQRPGVPTELTFAVDYGNPDDPAAKPPAVQEVVIDLAPGTRIDTSIPGLCAASDAELMLSGAAACPSQSIVGHGLVRLDTGLDPARDLANDVTILNNKDEIILLLESQADPPLRIVTRVRIDGSRLTSEVTGVPGGPPDGYTAIKQAELTLAPQATDGGNYVTTPPSCPPKKRQWTNTITFKYRDAVSQTVTSSVPCRRGPKKAGN